MPASSRAWHTTSAPPVLTSRKVCSAIPKSWCAAARCRTASHPAMARRRPTGSRMSQRTKVAPRACRRWIDQVAIDDLMARGEQRGVTMRRDEARAPGDQDLHVRLRTRGRRCSRRPCPERDRLRARRPSQQSRSYPNPQRGHSKSRPRLPMDTPLLRRAPGWSIAQTQGPALVPAVQTMPSISIISRRLIEPAGRGKNGHCVRCAGPPPPGSRSSLAFSSTGYAPRPMLPAGPSSPRSAAITLPCPAGSRDATNGRARP